MTMSRQRMFPPQAASDIGLQPVLKRVVYFGCHQIAEDSGCFIWSPRAVRGVAAPMEDVTDQDVETLMLEAVEDGYIWRYEAEGIQCGFLSTFPEWQQSLNRRWAPERVPLPPGVIFKADGGEQKNRNGSGRYTYPRSE